MRRNSFSPGDWVVYAKLKASEDPGKRAQQVSPATKGDTYTYVVDKYWVVAEVRDDDTILIRTRRGKRHELAIDDPALRPANWWERLRWRKRFTTIQHNMSNGVDSA